MVRRLALGSPYSKPSTATAEDSLPRPAQYSSFAGQSFVSIAAVHVVMQCIPRQLAMQRDDRSLNRPAQSGTLSDRAQLARALELYATRKSGDNTAHNERPAITATEAHVFQRILAAES